MANLEQIALATKPASGDLPSLRGVDIDGVSMPLRQAIGGDHLTYLDFKQHYDLDRRIREAEEAGREQVVAGLRQSQQRAGVLVADVSGHKATDALVAAMLHQARLSGCLRQQPAGTPAHPVPAASSLQVSAAWTGDRPVTHDRDPLAEAGPVIRSAVHSWREGR